MESKLNNGWLWFVRAMSITVPILMTLTMSIQGMISTDIAELKLNYKELNSNLHHEVTEIKERLARIETYIYKGR